MRPPLIDRDPGDEADTLEKRVAALEDGLRACIPWVATSGRGAAQEALAIACELTASDPYDWTSHPDVLTRRRAILGLPDRRKP